MIGLFHCPARSIQKFVLITKMSLEENFETHLKEKYANEQKEQNSEADIPDFRVGFFEILEETSDEWRRRARRRQLHSRSR